MRAADELPARLLAFDRAMRAERRTFDVVLKKRVVVCGTVCSRSAIRASLSGDARCDDAVSMRFADMEIFSTHRERSRTSRRLER